MSVITRRLAALVFALGFFAAALMLAGPSDAGPYAKPVTVGVSDQSPCAGCSLTVGGQGYQAGETVEVVMHTVTYALGSATADSSGDYSMVVSLPSGVTGTHTIVATGLTSGRSTSTTITIAAADGSGSGSDDGSPGGLAYTGAAGRGLGCVGVGRLIGGGLMLLAGKRRKITI